MEQSSVPPPTVLVDSKMIRGTCALLNASTSETQEANLEANFFAFTHFFIRKYDIMQVVHQQVKINFGENTMFGSPPRISTEFSQYQLLKKSNDKSEIS